MSATPRRSLARRVGCVAALVALLSVLGLEVLSRVADGVLERKKADPAFDPNPKTYRPTALDKIALDTLEYGELKRAKEQTNARTEPHPYLGYALKKSFRTGPSERKQATHDALGFRGAETTWEKPPGVFRIVTTGGSSVYGQSESNDEAVWSARLQNYLNADGRETKFEVVNAGVMGWSTFEMLINLELRALDLAPDLVIVYEGINDMRCALYTRGGPVENDNTHWRDVWPVDRPSALETLMSKSRAYLVWRRYFTDYTKLRVDLGFYAIKNYDPNVELYLHAPDPVPEGGFANYRRNLHTILSVCELRGAKPLVVTQALARWHLDQAPSRVEQLTAFDRIQAIEKEICAARGVAFFDLAKIVEGAAQTELEEAIEAALKANPARARADVEREMRAIGRGDLLFFSEVHPNDRGSDLIARTLAEHLLAGDLLPR